VLVTHVRYLLDRVSTVVLGLDGRGGAGRFADYSQWDAWQAERLQRKETPVPEKPVEARAASGKKKLSYLDAREFETIEQRIAAAEQSLAAKHAAMQDSEIMRDGVLLAQAYREMQAAQAEVDSLYVRWAELTEKQETN
jgi:ATP-binding cassette subfamily F protein uup